MRSDNSDMVIYVKISFEIYRSNQCIYLNHNTVNYILYIWKIIKWYLNISTILMDPWLWYSQLLWQSAAHFCSLQKKSPRRPQLCKSVRTLSYIGGSNGGCARDTCPLLVLFLSFSCRFLQKNCQIIDWDPLPFGVSVPLLGIPGSTNDLLKKVRTYWHSRRLNLTEYDWCEYNLLLF